MYGGGNEKTNRVRLTARQHFVVHRLLTKIYPDNSKLRWAFEMMFIHSKFNKRNDDFGWIRSVSKLYELHKLSLKPLRVEQAIKRNLKYGNPMQGKTHSPAAKAIISKTHKGRKQTSDHIKRRFLNKKAMNEKSRAQQADSLAKYYEIICPNGEKIVVKNLRKYCRDNNLNQGAMSRMTSPRYEGYQSNHKGYTIKKICSP